MDGYLKYSITQQYNIYKRKYFAAIGELGSSPIVKGLSSENYLHFLYHDNYLNIC